MTIARRTVPGPISRQFRSELADLLQESVAPVGRNGFGGGHDRTDFILTTKTGKKFAKNDLSKAIAKRLVEIGEPKGKYTLHGLRKAAAVRLAELGATVEDLMSFFGWRSPKMALFYTREASKRKLNRRAAKLLERAA